MWLTPRASYARLTINILEDNSPAYFGIYTMVEPSDVSFLNNKRFDDTLKDGNLWKSSLGGTLSSSYSDDDFGIGYANPTNDSLSYEPIYDYKTYNEDLYSNKTESLPDARDQIENFIDNLNGLSGDSFVAWITNAMDVDQFLKTYAVIVTLGAWDDYWGNNSNNYYLYFDENGKAYFIPYDYDGVLGVNLGSTDTGTQTPYNWNGSSDDPPLVSKILGVTQFKDQYTAYMTELIEPASCMFNFISSTNRILAWHLLIGSYDNNDTGENTSISDSACGGGMGPSSSSGYKLLTGSYSGTTLNFFRTKIKPYCTLFGLTYSDYAQ